ncbi:mechanosensitive ion channel domain-containing protein [Phyllobacterium endophyticum]|uniref:mechanosensitive ion channel domain-containing protein n=1 Tax=Phyllobacterium endophyticum TaxID=1149773 RepID=UPI001FEE3940|nr:mechanosensitive ion channel domain-containing protein [Phyllobacterium endophyticum]
MTTSEIIADPFIQTGALAVLGAVISRVALRSHPTWHLVLHVTFFVLLSVLLLYHGIVPYLPGPTPNSVVDEVLIGIAKIIWWVNAGWALIGFTRAFLIFEGSPREGRFIQDLVVGIIYLGVGLSIVANVFSLPVGTLIATSGVLAVILGLALQSTLNDVFSGIALNLGRPYAVGDVIVLKDGTEGKVVETNWRATHLLNGTNDLVVVPNSDLAKARLVNMSSPSRNHGVTITVSFAPGAAPALVADVMRAVLINSTTIDRTTGPGSVQVKGISGSAIDLELSIAVADIAKVGDAKNEIFDLIYRHAKAASLQLAAAAGTGIAATPAADQHPQLRSVQMRLLDAIPLFATLTDEEKEAIAKTMRRRTFLKGELIAEQGSVLNALAIVRSGVLGVTRIEDGCELELARLAPGDSYGEAGLLTEAGEPGTIRVLVHAVVYEIAKEDLSPLLHERPSLVDELGLILARRAEAKDHLFDRGSHSSGTHAVPGLVKRIRQLFEIPHGTH